MNNNTPNFETIFSPSVEPVESSDEPKLDEDAGITSILSVPLSQLLRQNSD